MIDFENLTDEQLVDLSLKDDKNFYYLMKRYEEKLGYYIGRITNISPEGIEDILQEVFIKVYKNLRGFNKKFKFSSWIYRIAHNEVISYYRKNRRALDSLSLDMDGTDNNNLVALLGDTLDMEEEQISKEKVDIVKGIFAELPPKYREVLVLRYLEEKSYDEISDILKKPPGSVATLINRAKSNFRKIMQRCKVEGILHNNE
ncbi:MAG: RNA polymerase sigma factor [Deltaproteobacteria bacterium]|nr:RNA polymerase sigma factor [Deltaproteobacteria bacterium]